MSETNQYQTRYLPNCIMGQMHLYFRPERYNKFPICNLSSTKRTEDRGYMHGLGIYVIRRITQRPFPTTTSRVCAIPIGQLTEVGPACGKRLALPLPQWVRNVITKFSPSQALQLIRLVGSVNFPSSVRGVISGEPRMLTYHSLHNWFISLLARQMRSRCPGPVSQYWVWGREWAEYGA